MKKIIPAKEIFVCDRCGITFDRSGNGGLHLEGNVWGKSYNGEAGGTSVQFDFCEKCLNDFYDWKSKK